ncbi:hypothetical protein HanXRQr2_Chr04g0144951 [Helianthus annuus]|uniref:Uncharacterized protein n=1 Tax=Helianthus annuus TaxID=4232 RepID=A0A9K3NPL6_HELAN|nr:hypothetical protein HanXRQr2_Chr04g0144951 [Helianthus annuus]
MASVTYPLFSPYLSSTPYFGDQWWGQQCPLPAGHGPYPTAEVAMISVASSTAAKNH